MTTEPRTAIICGFACTVNDALGHIEVAHDGSITWDQLQAIKNEVWGEEVRAIEVYPAQSNVVNGGNYRHLWRLGWRDFCPDLINPPAFTDTLSDRSLKAWAEARSVFRSGCKQ